MSSWSTCSSPIDSPSSSSPSTPPSATVEATSTTLKLPGIRDLFPDHIQRSALSGKYAARDLPSHPSTIFIPDHDPPYDDSQDSPQDSEYSYSSTASTHNPSSWEERARPRTQSITDPAWSDQPFYRSSTQRHQDVPYRRRAQTVAEDYPAKCGPPPIPNSPGRVHGRSATHICDLCGKRFDRPSSLRTHYNSHTGVTPFKCPWPHCGREFNVKSNMRRHYRKHQGMEQAQQPSLQAHDPHAPPSLLLHHPFIS